MSADTSKEYSPNNWYAFTENDKNLSEIITYMNNVVTAINKLCGNKLERFSNPKITDTEFKEFVKEAEKLGYKIYQLRKL